MSDNDSCQEIESEEDEDNCNAIDEIEGVEANMDDLPSHKVSSKIKYHINKFPTLSSNPFMNTENTSQNQSQSQSTKNSEDNLNQLHRNLLILSKKGDRESFLGTLEKILSSM